jgi:hypothetical protein
MPDQVTVPPVRTGRLLLAGAAAVLALANGCSGGLGHRSTAEMEGTIPLPDAVREVRCEAASGSFRVLAGAARQIAFQGGLRRAGNTAELLARVEQVPATMAAAPDPDQPDVLVLRGPTLPPGVTVGEAILGFEVTLTLPADVALTMTVAESGHLVVEDRRAAVRMSTQHGDLRLMRCQGPARIHTGRGMTIVYDHRGQLDVESGVGDVQVVVREPGPLLRLVTGIGNVQCLVPPDTGFRLDARTESGRVANGFGIVKERLSGQGAAMSGTRGDSRTEIVMRAGTGFLSLSYKTFD